MKYFSSLFTRILKKIYVLTLLEVRQDRVKENNELEGRGCLESVKYL